MQRFFAHPSPLTCDTSRACLRLAFLLSSLQKLDLWELWAPIADPRIHVPLERHLRNHPFHQGHLPSMTRRSQSRFAGPLHPLCFARHKSRIILDFERNEVQGSENLKCVSEDSRSQKFGGQSERIWHGEAGRWPLPPLTDNTVETMAAM